MARFRSISLLFVLFLFTSLLPGQQEERVDWQYEIDLLGRELASRHKELFFHTDSAAFFRSLDRVADQAGDKSVFHVSVELQQVMAGLGDAHTQVNYHYFIDKQSILPLECYWFKDGLHILRAREDYQEMLGKKIRAINRYPIEQVIDSMSTLITSHNPSLVKNAIPRMITWAQLLDHFGFGGSGTVELQLENPEGALNSRIIELPARESEMVPVQPDSVPLGWQDRKFFFRQVYLPGDRLYYIQYNKCWSREAEKLFGSGASALFMPSFKEFEKEVLETIRREDVEKLVLDLRFNSGGNSLQGTRFIHKLGKTKIRKHAKVYLLVGRKTFSSAMINAVDLMETFDVVTLGENTGGKPNHFGEVKRFVLPESNLVVNYSTKYFTLLDEDPPAIIPDIHTPDTFEEYMKGTDPALEAVRNHNAR